MSSISAIALSGMASASTGLGSSAHNIANMQTEGFRRQTVGYRELDGGGVTARVDRAATPGHAIERDVVDQISAKNAFLANLAVFRTSDAMAGEVLDLMA